MERREIKKRRRKSLPQLYQVGQEDVAFLLIPKTKCLRQHSYALDRHPPWRRRKKRRKKGEAEEVEKEEEEEE